MSADAKFERIYKSMIETGMNKLVPKDKEPYPAQNYKEAHTKMWRLDEQISKHFGATPGREGPEHCPGESYYKWADHIDLYSSSNFASWEEINQDLVKRYAHRTNLLAKLLDITAWLAERYDIQ